MLLSFSAITPLCPPPDALDWTRLIAQIAFGIGPRFMRFELRCKTLKARTGKIFGLKSVPNDDQECGPCREVALKRRFKEELETDHRLPALLLASRIDEIAMMNMPNQNSVVVSVREISFQRPEYFTALQLRLEILRHPLKIGFSEADLHSDRTAHHIAAFDSEGNLVACLILARVTADMLKMRQAAVSAALQGKGIGQQLVTFAEHWARDHAYKEIVLSAREVAVNFYLRMGYKTVGERYTEVTIPHFKMHKNLI